MKPRSPACQFPRAALIALLLVGGCDSGRDEPSPPRAPATPLAGRVVYSSDSLAAPISIEWVAGRLVVIDAMADSQVKVVDPALGRLERAFGRRGKGPGEYSAPWSMDAPQGEQGSFWIFDPQLRRLTHVDLARDFQPGRKPGERLVHLGGEFTVTSPVFLGDGSIVTPGMMVEPGRVARFDTTGTLVGLFGTPPEARKGVPPQVAQHAYQSIARANPERTMFALATRHADRLEIYRADGSPVAVARGPDRFDPVYTVRGSGGQPELATGDDLRFGYVGLATTPDRIFALYSGKTRAEAPGRANFGTSIHVFDWRGNLREIWPLDSAVLGLAVDPDGRTLYTTRHDPEPAVLAYTLPAAEDQ